MSFYFIIYIQLFVLHEMSGRWQTTATETLPIWKKTHTRRGDRKQALWLVGLVAVASYFCHFILIMLVTIVYWYSKCSRLSWCHSMEASHPYSWGKALWENWHSGVTAMFEGFTTASEHLLGYAVNSTQRYICKCIYTRFKNATSFYIPKTITVLKWHFALRRLNTWFIPLRTLFKC